MKDVWAKFLFEERIESTRDITTNLKEIAEEYDCELLEWGTYEMDTGRHFEVRKWSKTDDMEKPMTFLCPDCFWKHKKQVEKGKEKMVGVEVIFKNKCDFCGNECGEASK